MNDQSPSARRIEKQSPVPPRLSQHPSDIQGDRYVIRVAGHMDEAWSAWMGDLTISHEGTGASTLTGRIADQAALFRILLQIRDLGLPSSL